MRGIVFFIGCIVCCACAGAQEVTYSADTAKVFIEPVVIKPIVKPPRPPKPVVHELSFGIRLNTNGWSAFTDYGKAKTQDMKRVDMFHNVLYYQLELTEKRDPKEEKIPSSASNRVGSSNSYKYGKINNFYGLKLGLGYEKMIAGKPDPGCVSIHWASVAGFSLGLLKPYFINVYGDPQAIKYTDITQGDFLDHNIIQGSAGFSKGLDELQFIPGGHIKSAIRFDFSTNKKNVIGVETGVNAEFYSQQIQLMANQPATSSFYDIYVAFQFGKRW